MFDGNFNGAILSFKEALLYQKSNYLKLTIYTMIMQCYSVTNDSKKEYYENELKKWIDEHPNDDPAIIRKICMNLCIYFKKNEMIIDAKHYLNKIINKIERTSSEYRALKLQNELYDMDNNIEKKYNFVNSGSVPKFV